MSKDVKTVSEFFGDDQKLLVELQPAVADFQQLLWKLAAKTGRK